ncbi:unnamed protein product [Dibothriocephalus latus]|uniref:G-protein coupled receptors family 1 profile domain-containing protein n=1 Tax=Dibothriocephalus latus TaxID=60516 RepID=A0A3P7LI12_DIBLA|nr:unnamed protein product [Dibothriocephalus latus]
MIKNYQLCLLLELLLFTAADFLGQQSKNDTQLAVSEDLTDLTTLLDTAIPEDATGAKGETVGPTTTEAIPEITSSKTTLKVTVKDWFYKFDTLDATSISSVSSADLSAAVTEEPTEAAIPTDSLDQKTQNDIQSTIPEELDDTTRLIQLATTLLDDGITEDLKEGDVITDDLNIIEADSENTPAKTTMMVTEKDRFNEFDASSAISISAVSNDDLFVAVTEEPTETAISTDIPDQQSENDTQTTVLEDPNDTTDQMQFKTTVPDDATTEDAMIGEFYTDGLTTTVAMSQTTPGKTTVAVTEQEESTDVDAWSTTSPSTVSSTTSTSTVASTTSTSTVSSTELPTTITEETANVSIFVNDTLVELNETLQTETSPNQTLVIEVTTTVKPGRPPPHPCLADIDEGEPEFQRYICVGNVVVSYFATIFLLTLILFGVSNRGFKVLVAHHFYCLMKAYKPELAILLFFVFFVNINPYFFRHLRCVLNAKASANL